MAAFHLLFILLVTCAATIHGGQDTSNTSQRGRQRASPPDATDEDAPGDLLPEEDIFSRPGSSDSMQISCKQRSRCSKRGDTSFGFYDQNCFCDDMCKMYGDCCNDYKGSLPDTIPEGFKLPKRTLACSRVIPIDQTAEIYRVEKCPKDYEDAFVREKCEDAHSLDQFLEIPVSGTLTGVLYKNYYCAICAGDVDLSFWNVKWQCENGPTVDNVTDTEQLLDDVWFMGGGNCIYEFTHPTMAYRMCKSHLSRCPKHWDGDPAVERKCKENTAYTYVDGSNFMIFENKYCAQCYGINATYLTCRDPRSVGVRDHIPDSTSSMNNFSILLDLPTGTGLVHDNGSGGTSERTITFRQCDDHHVYDPFNKICRRIACPAEERFVQGDCVSKDMTSPRRTSTRKPKPTSPIFITTATRRPKSPSRRTTDSDIHFTPSPGFFPSERHYPGEDETSNGHHQETNIMPGHNKETNVVLDCPLSAYNQSEFIRLQNKSVVLTSSQQVYDKGSYMLDGSSLYVCASLMVRNKTQPWKSKTKILMFQFDRIQNLVSFIGVLISLVSLLICFVAHMILPPIRTVAGKCIIGLSVSLFVGQGLYLAGNLGIDHELACMVIGIVMHYAFIASFCWTNCLALDICQAFASSRSTQGDNNSKRYVYHSLYSWIFPAVLVGACVALDMFDFSSLGIEDELDMFRPYYGDSLCWITRRNALLFLYAVPVGVFILVNFITFIATIKNIYSVPVVAKAASRRDKDKNKFLLYIKLTFIMALTWTFAFLATMTHLQFLWYLFLVFNSLQGAFICFAFVCTRKVFRLLKTIGRVHKSNNSNQRPYHRAYSNATSANNPWGYSRSNFLYEGMDSKVISQETSI